MRMLNSLYSRAKRLHQQSADAGDPCAALALLCPCIAHRAGLGISAFRLPALCYTQAILACMSGALTVRESRLSVGDESSGQPQRYVYRLAASPQSLDRYSVDFGLIGRCNSLRYAEKGLAKCRLLVEYLK